MASSSVCLFIGSISEGGFNVRNRVHSQRSWAVDVRPQACFIVRCYWETCTLNMSREAALILLPAFSCLRTRRLVNVAIAVDNHTSVASNKRVRDLTLVRPSLSRQAQHYPGPAPVPDVRVMSIRRPGRFPWGSRPSPSSAMMGWICRCWDQCSQSVE